MSKQIDGVIEAVRYKNGHISMVRAFERRGAAFSDWLLLDRKRLLERLQDGKQFMTGTRETLMAGTFHVEKAVRLVKQNDHEWITTREDAERDVLEGVPLF